MLDRELLEKAIKISTEESKKEATRIKNRDMETRTEVIFVPCVIEYRDDNNKIGCITHSNVMKVYNDLYRDKIEKRENKKENANDKMEKWLNNM